MDLDDHVCAILDNVAKSILCDKGLQTVNLYDLLWPLKSNRDAVLEYLVREVEHCSGGVSTIRIADKALFRDHNSGVELYLVLCPIETKEVLVTTMADDMVLVYIHPGVSGLKIDAPRASESQIRAYRELFQ